MFTKEQNFTWVFSLDCQLENSLPRKRSGGLGVRSLSKMNKALFCKWCWRFANERDSLWRLVINTKFGEGDGGWNTNDIRGGYATGL